MKNYLLKVRFSILCFLVIVLIASFKSDKYGKEETLQCSNNITVRESGPGMTITGVTISNSAFNHVYTTSISNNGSQSFYSSDFAAGTVLTISVGVSQTGTGFRAFQIEDPFYCKTFTKQTYAYSYTVQQTCSGLQITVGNYAACQ